MFQTSYRSGYTDSSFYYVSGDENSVIQSGVKKWSGNSWSWSTCIWKTQESLDPREIVCLKQDEDSIQEIRIQ